ncbi:MAG TPA: alpha-E domain-containing protein [Propionibacteriaceae bacterium]|nr:alpha-E domain-containing protein [Propionibacteriaceae bacterium]HPZ48608.1 alpha-E domain-containing protein [Propionibacteriaceae bacterium]HQE30913.1 alpha-E domain-containing protein [Propionibacteriaceae bacterium]
MLSRIAESLYWIGRYLERAEDTSRILDVHLQLVVNDPGMDVTESATTLMTVLGVPIGDTPPTPRDVLEALLHDPRSACSVTSSLSGARESARRARETVPPEMWEGLNTTWNALRAGQLRTARPTTGLAYVRERCVLIAGIADTTMSHDEGWLFLQLGRSVERIDMTARLMLWAAVTRRSGNAWNTALRASGALHAFRRSHGVTLDREAAEFLLLDRLFPRSVVHCLTLALDALAALEPDDRRSGFESQATRLLGRVRAELEYHSLSEVLDALPERLATLQQVCVATDAAITSRYFTGAASPSWSGGGS